MTLNTKISEHQAVSRTQSFCHLHMSGYQHNNRFRCHSPKHRYCDKSWGVDFAGLP